MAKTILENIPFSPERDPGSVWVSEPDGSRETRMPKLPLPVLAQATIAGIHNPEGQITVNALLDTGTDITFVNRSIIERLDREFAKEEGPVPLARQINNYDNVSNVKAYQKAYKLKLTLGGHSYASVYGFIVPQVFLFEGMDIWVGQDILQQLIVTFDGPKKTITVVDPNLT